MSEPDDGTTEFKAGSLRELLDEGDKPAKAPKGGGGPGLNRQIMIGGGAAAVLIVVVLVAVLAGGGKDKKPTDDGGRTAFPVNVRSSIITSGVIKNARVSICGKDNEPLAENVLIVNKSNGQEITGLAALIKLEVSTTPAEQSKLAAYRPRTGEITVFVLPTCPPASDATTASTGAPATTPASEATTQPPASTTPSS